MLDMFSIKNITFLLAAITFAFGEAALVDSLKKCSVKDEKCLKGFFQSIIEALAKDGAPELGINKIDPIDLEDISVSVLGILNITLLEGELVGVRSCEIKRFNTDLTQGKSSLHVLCDKLIILGQYDIKVFGPILQLSTLNINNFHGRGDGKIVLDKFDLHLEYAFHFEKKDDGEHFKFTISGYTFHVLEKASFEADNLINGDKEASKEVIKYMNSNWKVILETFGKYFFDKAMEYISDFTVKVFDNVPTKYFITEDLTPYVKQ